MLVSSLTALALSLLALADRRTGTAPHEIRFLHSSLWH